VIECQIKLLSQARSESLTQPVYDLSEVIYLLMLDFLLVTEFRQPRSGYCESERRFLRG
jgi:hypothetical protein